MADPEPEDPSGPHQGPDHRTRERAEAICSQQETANTRWRQELGVVQQTPANVGWLGTKRRQSLVGY